MSYLYGLGPLAPWPPGGRTGCPSPILSHRIPCGKPECAGETGPTHYTDEPALYQDLAHRSPTNQGLGPNSTQKTMGENCPPYIYYAPLPSISDVGLNLTITPVTHQTQLFHHKQPG